MAAVINSAFLDTFPKIKYDINRSQYPYYDTVTNIFFRYGIIKHVLDTVNAYYYYDIEEGETPEILAEKVYGDSGVGWIIVYANNIFDPQFDWPLDTRSFNKYITGKYGTIDNAKTKIHHYEKIITRFNTNGEQTTVNRITIDGDMLTDDPPPNVTYETYQNLASTEVSYVLDGNVITEKVTKAIISAYDHEVEMNDNKRTIKVIKSDYYQLIMNQFADLTTTNPLYIRRLV